MTERITGLIHGTMPEEQGRIAAILEAGVEQPQALFWQYDQAAVIMGCSQKPMPDQEDRANAAGLPITRRRSGGGAVLAGPWMLSVTLFIPTDHPVSQQNIIEIFGWFEQIWIAALERCGVPCRGVNPIEIDRSKVISEEQGLKWACYAGLSHGELVSPDGRKLVGLAQIRKRKGVALVSGLHLSPCNWDTLSSVVVDRPEQGELLQALNADAETLSGQPAEQILPAVINALTDLLPADFRMISR